MALDPAWIALIGTLCGGAGLKFAEHYLGKSKVKTDDATRIRDELRLQIVSQAQEIKELELAMEKWRKEYYDLRDKSITRETELLMELNDIKRAAIKDGHILPQPPQ